MKSTQENTYFVIHCIAIFRCLLQILPLHGPKIQVDEICNKTFAHSVLEF